MILTVFIIMMIVLISCYYQNRIYRIPEWKLFIAACLMVAVGFLGTRLMFHIERNAWGGMSFFGCVFAVPPVLYLYAKISGIKTEDLMDIAGPVCAITLTILKLHCLYEGCCGGKVLFQNMNGENIRFPSQIVEAVCGVILYFILLRLQRKESYRGCIAPLFLIIYGSSRFILNFFRIDSANIRFLEETGVYLEEGNFWSLICIGWGLIWLNKRRKIANK